MVKKRTPLHFRLILRIYEFYQFVIFGNSLKNLNLNIRRSHPQLQGCVVSIYELDKNISRRSKQEHDKTGIHRQSNSLKESSSYIHYYKSKKLPLCHATPRCLNSKDTAFAANKVSLNTCTVKW